MAVSSYLQHISDIVQLPLTAGIFSTLFVSVFHIHFSITRKLFTCWAVLFTVLCVVLIFCSEMRTLRSHVFLFGVLVFLVRILRVRYRGDLTKRMLDLRMLLIDIPVLFLIGSLSFWIFHSLLYNSIVGLIHFGTLYVLCSIYVLSFLREAFPQHFLLAHWRLLVDAFPEGGGHNRQTSDRTNSRVTFTILLGWMLSIVCVFAIYLAVLYLTLFSWFVIIVPTIYLLGYIILITQRGTFRVRKNKFEEILAAGAILNLGVLPMMVGIGGWNFYIDPQWDIRLGTTLAIATPLFMHFFEFPSYFETAVKRTIANFRKKLPTWDALANLTVGIRSAIFNRRIIVQWRAGLIATVFLLYYMIPQLPFFLRMAGMENEIGKHIIEIIGAFVAIKDDWTLFNPHENSSARAFILGNQGVVLLTLAWNLATVIIFITETSDRMQKPAFFSRISGISWKTMIAQLLFLLFLSPFFVSIGLSLPFLGAMMMGTALSVLLGAFAFSLLLPTLLCFLIAVGMLILAIEFVRPNIDTIPVNSAPKEQLILLPNIGKRIARRIVETRPQKIDDLQCVSKFGSAKLSTIQALIRFD